MTTEPAERVGVPPTTLRYHEREGLLPAQRTGARPVLHHLFGEDTPVRSAC